jgi:hypothetical protein
LHLCRLSSISCPYTDQMIEKEKTVEQETTKHRSEATKSPVQHWIDRCWMIWVGLCVSSVVVGAAFLTYIQIEPTPKEFHPPKFSDFTPPYTCPADLTPRSCEVPIKVFVECVDLRTINPKNLTRPLTEKELSNGEKACELLPQWLDQDLRIEIVADRQDAVLFWKYDFSVTGPSFTGIRIFVNNTNFLVGKPFQEPYDTAAYFVAQSILQLGNRGYLP